MSHVRSTLLGALSLAIVTACVSEAPRSGVSGGEVAATPTPEGASVTPSADTAPSADRKAAPSTRPLATATSAGAPAGSVATTARSDSINPKLVAGRGKKDAMSFAAAIRAGTRKESTWPAGPAPAAGVGPPGQLDSLREPARIAAAKLIPSFLLRPATSLGLMLSLGEDASATGSVAAGSAVAGVPAEGEAAALESEVAPAGVGPPATSPPATPDFGASAAQAVRTSSDSAPAREERTGDM